MNNFDTNLLNVRRQDSIHAPSCAFLFRAHGLICRAGRLSVGLAVLVLSWHEEYGMGFSVTFIRNRGVDAVR